MLGTILKGWLALHLGRASYRYGYGTPTMPLWKWLGWLLLGVLAEWMLLQFLVSTVNVIGAEYEHRASPRVDPLVHACILIGLWVLLPCPFCWLYGRWKSPPRVRPNDHYYFAQDGQTHGPFSIQSIVEMHRGAKLGDDTQLCREGSDAWEPCQEVFARLPKPPGRLAIWKNTALAHAKEALNPSPKMNYRILIPALALAMISGALLHSWLGERYRFHAVGNGHTIKTDRWTGQAWKNYIGQPVWEPIQDQKSGPVTYKFTRRKDGKVITIVFDTQPAQSDIDWMQARIDAEEID